MTCKFDCESSWWKMAFNNGNDDAQAQAQPQNPKKNLSNLNLSPSPSPPPQAQNGVSKVKSCRGSLYYSSLRKSKSKSPTCVGFSGTLDQCLSPTLPLSLSLCAYIILFLSDIINWRFILYRACSVGLIEESNGFSDIGKAVWN